MAKAIECDRCKAKQGLSEYEFRCNQNPDSKWLFMTTDMARDIHIDLCPNCANAFREFMRGVKES